MDPALEICRRAADALEHFRHRFDVPRLARMTGAKQCDLLLRESEALHATAGHEWQRLQRLQRAARRGEVMRVSCCEEELARAIDDCNRPVMHAVGCITSRNDGKRDVRRSRATNARQGRGSSRKALFYRARTPDASYLGAVASASRICSRAPASSIVVRSPGSRPSASA